MDHPVRSHSCAANTSGRSVLVCRIHTWSVTDGGRSTSRFSGRNHTPSRNSPKRLCRRVVRKSLRSRASRPTLVITSCFQVPSHEPRCGSHASSCRS
ncbi:Uncharacterised protein [Mycobacteroides abscessus subsp. abscessus]|nr:Uncharacterised protein [Mycobacteroides abscessus subsp. abscessus]